METERVEHDTRHGLDGFLSKPKVLETIGAPSSSTFNALRRGGGFPEPVRLSPTARRLYWRASEVAAWMARRSRG